MTLRVAVCDDDPVRVGDWASQIEQVAPAGSTVEAVAPESLASAVGALRNRAYLAKAEKEAADDAASLFDTADVVIIDSDLTPVSSSNYDNEALVREGLSSEMGGEIAHLVRSQTFAGAIVVVNEGAQSRTFDLTMVRRLTGVADVYVTTEDVANPGLWQAHTPDPNTYRPWTWPRLSHLPRVISEAAEGVNLDQPLYNFLGLEPGELTQRGHARQLETLPLDQLNNDDPDADQVSLRLLAASEPWGLRVKERTDDSHLRRVAVCAARRWADRVLLPSMNILIDAPHLLQERPWLIMNRTSLESWNNGYWWPVDGDRKLAERDAYNPKASSLLDRDVWSVQKLPPPPKGARIESTDPVFCEDTGSFVQVELASDVMTDLEGSYPRRFVADLPGTRYQPRSRLAL